MLYPVINLRRRIRLPPRWLKLETLEDIRRRVTPRRVVRSTSPSTLQRIWRRYGRSSTETPIFRINRIFDLLATVETSGLKIAGAEKLRSEWVNRQGKNRQMIHGQRMVRAAMVFLMSRRSRETLVLANSANSLAVSCPVSWCPHNSRTPARPSVRTLCTRAARGCPADLPAYAPARGRLLQTGDTTEAPFATSPPGFPVPPDPQTGGASPQPEATALHLTLQRPQALRRRHRSRTVVTRRSDLDRADTPVSTATGSRCL